MIKKIDDSKSLSIHFDLEENNDWTSKLLENQITCSNTGYRDGGWRGPCCDAGSVPGAEVAALLSDATAAQSEVSMRAQRRARRRSGRSRRSGSWSQSRPPSCPWVPSRREGSKINTPSRNPHCRTSSQLRFPQKISQCAREANCPCSGFCVWSAARERKVWVSDSVRGWPKSRSGVLGEDCWRQSNGDNLNICLSYGWLLFTYPSYKCN
jgi:hypothetical protein